MQEWLFLKSACVCNVRYTEFTEYFFMWFQQFIVQTRFVCQFNIEGRVTSVNAQLLGDTIYCDTMEFSYTSRAPNISASFAVIWGGSKPLDNPDNVHGMSGNSWMHGVILYLPEYKTWIFPLVIW